jgi:two-component system response regulator YesN
MNLLIVDDERIIIEDIRSSVNWDSLHIERVYEAISAEEAKRVCSGCHVDIMLCDIEMPQVNGLELLAWVKDEYPETEVIILTCHASFSFAKEAIRLKCMDYLLKPVNVAELETIVKSAQAKIWGKEKLKESSSLGQFWVRHQPVFVEKFWMDILNGVIESRPAAICEEADNRNILYQDDMRFLPLLIAIKSWNCDTLQDEIMVQQAVRKAASALFCENGLNSIFVSLEQDYILGIIPMNEEMDVAFLQKICGQFINLDPNKNRELGCYIGRICMGHGLIGVVEELKLMDMNNVAQSSGVFFLRNQAAGTGSQIAMDMDGLTILLRTGRAEEFLAQVRSSLNEKARTNTLDRGYLIAFRHDIEQILYCVLHEYGISAHQLFSGEKWYLQYNRATESFQEMLHWAQDAVGRTELYIQKFHRPNTAADQIKKYIRDNMDQDLSRESIAKQVYLNPDYLDRLFKKETGMSVNKYVQKLRIEYAQVLLGGNKYSVNQIAMMVGYTNMSNFSAMFKRSTGLAPADYRRSLCTKKREFEVDYS